MSEIRVASSNSFTRFRNEDIEQSIPSRFEEMVSRFPDRLAIKSNFGERTYLELDQAANQIAHAILDRCGGQEEPIALMFGDSTLEVSAILGVLKAGKIYITLDPTFPPARLHYILKDAGVAWVLTDRYFYDVLQKIPQQADRIINLSDLENDYSDQNLDQKIRPDAIARIAYTSGSTGTPKGCFIDHRSFLHQAMNLTNAFQICPEDRITYFHRWVSDLTAALLNGASLFPWNFQEEGLSTLARWVAQEQITLYSSVPTLFRHITDSLSGNEHFPNLRLIALTGEPVYRRDVELYKKHFSSNCVFVNRLGANETLTISMQFIDKNTRCEEDWVSMGRPIEGKDVILLDEAGQEETQDSIGEIAVRSQYIARGYWRHPELTQEKFLHHPQMSGPRMYRTGDLGRILPDGSIVHMGRKDFQIKIRGHRVEPLEIESALLECEAIQKAVVHAKTSESGEQKLVAYLVVANGYLPNVSDLRAMLSEKFPDHMIPSAFIVLGSFPISPSGKIDRLSLPDPGGDRPNLNSPFTLPRSELEKEIAEIWRDVLRIDQVGVHDEFLEVGGDSLRATQILSRIRQRMNVEVSMATAFDIPTVSQMASFVSDQMNHPVDEDDMARLMAEGLGGFQND